MTEVLLITLDDVSSAELQYKPHVGSVGAEQTQMYLSRRLQKGWLVVIAGKEYS